MTQTPNLKEKVNQVSNYFGFVLSTESTGTGPPFILRDPGDSNLVVLLHTCYQAFMSVVP